MTTHRPALLMGVLAALLATFAWALSFIVPYVVGAYSLFDFALIEFVVSGIASGVYLAVIVNRPAYTGPKLQPRDWGAAFAVGAIGYAGYFLALVGAAKYAGPVIAPAFLGLVPVSLAVIGNLRQPTIAWRKLVFPLSLAALGLLLVNAGNLKQSDADTSNSLPLGLALSILAVALWTVFGLLNQSALERRPAMDSGVWTALIMVGAGGAMLLFLPLGLALGAFEIPRLGLSGGAAGLLILWGAALAIVVNGGGALCWTLATRRLPVVLAAQLVTMEPMFGTVFGLIFRRQWPTLTESLGLATLLIGVVIAIRIFHGQRDVVALTADAMTKVQ